MENAMQVPHSVSLLAAMLQLGAKHSPTSLLECILCCPRIPALHSNGSHPSSSLSAQQSPVYASRLNVLATFKISATIGIPISIHPSLQNGDRGYPQKTKTHAKALLLPATAVNREQHSAHGASAPPPIPCCARPPPKAAVLGGTNAS